MNFSAIVRFFAQPAVIAVGGSTFVHSAAAAIILYLLLTAPFLWEIEIRRGEAVVIQAQMAAVAATQLEAVEVAVQPSPVDPPAAVAIDHAPVRDNVEPIPAAIPVVRIGEYEPQERPPQQQPPESPAPINVAKTPPREVVRRETPPAAAPPQTLPDRKVAEFVRNSPSKVNSLAAAPSVAGAQVDELPRKLPNNREPYYPIEALRAGLEGRVVLRVQISAAGRASKITIESSSGAASFDESAIAAVREWRFSPARRQGTPVAHEVLVPVRFRIYRG